MSLLDTLLRKVIKINGVDLRERKTWNFISGVSGVDNEVTGETDLTITGVNNPTITGTVTYQGDGWRVVSIGGKFVSIGAVTDVVAQFTMLDETTCTFDFTCSMKAVGAVGKAGRWDGKATYYRTGGGAPTIVGAIEYGTAFATTVGDGVILFVSGNIVKVIATAADSDNRNWSCEFRVQETLAT